jgi:phosphonatase-like hydrolase
MEIRKFDFVLFDLIGTTVRDTDRGESLILDSFHKAIISNGFQVSIEEINQQRGKSKKEAIKILLEKFKLNNKLIDKIYNDFMGFLNSSINNFKEINGAGKLFEMLKGKGVKIGIGSGLPLEFMLSLVRHVGWQLEMFEYIGSSENLGKGRPDPIMIFDSMAKLNIIIKEKVLKVGDTIVDIQEGKNAGVVTAGVLSGTQGRETLEKHNPDYIFKDINGLLKII